MNPIIAALVCIGVVLAILAGVWCEKMDRRDFHCDISKPKENDHDEE